MTMTTRNISFCLFFLSILVIAGWKSSPSPMNSPCQERVSNMSGKLKMGEWEEWAQLRHSKPVTFLAPMAKYETCFLTFYITRWLMRLTLFAGWNFAQVDDQTTRGYRGYPISQGGYTAPKGRWFQAWESYREKKPRTVTERKGWTSTARDLDRVNPSHLSRLSNL